MIALCAGLPAVFLILVFAFVLYENVTGPPEAADWDPVLAPYVDFVAETRGLPFEQTVEVQFLDIEASLRESKAGEEADFDDETRAYFQDVGQVNAILGLTDPGVDPWASEADVIAEGAAAYYDAEANVIVLPAPSESSSNPSTASGPGDRSESISAMLEVSIVHELTHALQHQHGLLFPPAATQDQSSMSLALVEGDATRIENLWLDSLSQTDFAAYEQALAIQQEAYIEEDYASYFGVKFAAPYILGEAAVHVLLESGGQPALDQAMASGTLTTEMLVDPLSATPESAPAKKRFAESSGPEDSTVTLGGTVGPLKLFQILAPALGAGAAQQAIAGYDADSFEYWSTGSQSCVDLRIWFADEAQAQEFADLAVGSFGTAEVSEHGVPRAPSLSYLLCDEALRSVAAGQHFEMLYPLVLHSYLAQDVVSYGWSPGVATCSAAVVALEGDPEFSDSYTFADALGDALAVAESDVCVASG